MRIQFLIAMIIMAIGVTVEAAAQTDQETSSREGNENLEQSAIPAEESAGAEDSDLPELIDETTISLTGGAEAADDAGDTIDSGFSFWELLRMILILGVIIGIIYFVVRILKRSSLSRFPHTKGMRLLGSLPLPGSRAIHLVEVGAHIFLIGAGEGGVNCISEIEDKETQDELRRNASEQSGGRKSFTELLSTILPNETLKNKFTSTIHRKREQLKRL